MKIELENLHSPFKTEDIEWRVQRTLNTAKGPKAVVLAYVTNRAIMNRLDEVFGVGNWMNEYKEWRDKGVLCGISAKIDGEWVTKWDGAEETNIEAVKGGFSGSMKRAAVQWGIGRYLYNLDETWVDLKERGQNYVKFDNKPMYWDNPVLPAWALPTLKVQDVLNEWIDKGGTAQQFDEKIKKEWGVTRNDLKQNHLKGLKTLLDKKKVS